MKYFSLLLLMICSMTYAQQVQKPSEQVVFEDRFDSQMLDTRWLLRVPGENNATWELKDGLLQASADPGKNGMMLLDEKDWGNYTVSVMFRFVQDQPRNLGLVFHASPPKGRHPVYFTGMIFSLQEKTATLHVVDPVWRKLQRVSMLTLEHRKWYQMRVQIEDEMFTCYVDDKKIIQEEFGKMPAGGAGLRLSSGASADLKNFQVTVSK